MEVIILKKEQWKRLALDCKMSSIYQDSRWLELIETVYPGLRVWRLGCRNAKGDMTWLLPLVEIKPIGRLKPMMISVPFGNYGGFLYPKNSDHTASGESIIALNSFFNKSPAFAMEIREIASPLERFTIDDQFKRFEVPFPEKIEDLWNNTVTGNVRTSVRKADKLGVEVLFDHAEALPVFQSIYEFNASYHGTPVHHRNWYKHLMKLFHDEAEIVLARYEGRYIGALLIMYYQEKAILHAAVTDPHYYKIPATEKLLWAAFEKLMKEGKIHFFDFGRTRPVSGKMFFKKKWGGKELPIYYCYFVKDGYRIPRIVPENEKLGVAIKAWQLLPMRLKNFIGPFFRTRIPT